MPGGQFQAQKGLKGLENVLGLNSDFLSWPIRRLERKSRSNCLFPCNCLFPFRLKSLARAVDAAQG